MSEKQNWADKTLRAAIWALDNARLGPYTLQFSRPAIQEGEDLQEYRERVGKAGMTVTIQFSTTAVDVEELSRQMNEARGSFLLGITGNFDSSTDSTEQEAVRQAHRFLDQVAKRKRAREREASEQARILLNQLAKRKRPPLRIQYPLQGIIEVPRQD